MGKKNWINFNENFGYNYEEFATNEGTWPSNFVSGPVITYLLSQGLHSLSLIAQQLQIFIQDIYENDY